MKMLSLALLCCIIGYAAAGFAPSMRRGSLLKAPYLPDDTPLPAAQWVDQKLDHLSNTSNSAITWKQRYFVNSTWWDKGGNGPVFLLLGGEGPASPAWIVANTNIMICAKKYKALVFSVEHRFYGQSHPTSDASVEHLKFLSSEQALADFAHFHDLMVTQYLMTDSHKWISFGGSYSGALSAWLRQVYPKVVVGAVASSAPVLAKMDFVEYVEVVAASLGTAGSDCTKSVKIAASYVSSVSTNKKAWKELGEMFNVKPPLSSAMDTVGLMENLAGNFEGVVQYNRDNTAFEGRSNNITIKDLCAMMTDATLGVAPLRYAAVNKLMQGGNPMDCNFKDSINFLKKSSWSSAAVESGARQWTYQTCTEFGYFQTTNSKKTSIFSDKIQLDFYTEQCSQVFGISTSEIATAINKTNKFYGGRNVTGTNIVFPNGSIDPWHALSIITNLGPTVEAVYINGTAHCANMYPPRPSDPAGLTEARATISALIGKWVGAS